MNLSKQMRTALQQARHAPHRRVHNPNLPGTPPWPAAANTLHALARHGLLEPGQLRNRHGHHVQLWTITDAGHAALRPPERHVALRDEYVSRPSSTGDYTEDPSRSLDYEWATVTTPDGRRVCIRNPTANIDPDRLQRRWRHHADQRHAAAQDPRQRARRAARNTRATT